MGEPNRIQPGKGKYKETIFEILISKSMCKGSPIKREKS